MEAPTNGNGWIRNIVWGVVLIVAILAFSGGKYYVQSISEALTTLQSDMRKVEEKAKESGTLLAVALAENKTVVAGLFRLEGKVDALLLTQGGAIRTQRR